MGICQGSDRQHPIKQISQFESSTDEEELENKYIIHLIDSSNIPISGVDLQDGIEAYIKINVKSSEGRIKTGEPFTEHKSTIRHDCDSPTWNTMRKIIANKNDVVDIELYDEDTISSDDFLGVATISINSDLKFDTIINLPFEMKNDKFKELGTNIRLKIYKESELSFKDKRIYFIRHGESEFNAALERSDLVEMWSKTDHPLNLKGIEQSLCLSDKIEKAIDDEEENEIICKDVQDFLDAEAIWTSPLSRAAQTAFIGLKEHPRLIKSGVVLLANCREFKSIGGRDSTGSKVGSDIKNRCLEKLKKYKDDGFVQKYKQIAWDFNDCSSKWWSGINDKGKKDIDERFNDFINFVRYRPERNIIIVSHSVFIRYFFKRYLAPKDNKNYDDVFNQRYETAYFNDDEDDEEVVKKEEEEEKDNNNELDYNSKLSTYKLENGGCIRVDLKFNDSYRDGVIIKDTKLMFDSQLKKRGKKINQNKQ